MIWLQSPPWGRWLMAAMIALIALWIEFRPDPVVEHPFATVEIDPGESIGSWNVEWRRVTVGLFDPVSPGDVAVRTVPAGNPVLTTDLGDGLSLIPGGWWAIEIEIARDAKPGDRAMVVMLDSGTLASAVVVSGPSDDPLGGNRGAIAVEPRWAAEAAAAAAQGRLAVMIETG